jgi:hypothetical protein
MYVCKNCLSSLGKDHTQQNEASSSQCDSSYNEDCPYPMPNNLEEVDR